MGLTSAQTGVPATGGDNASCPLCLLDTLECVPGAPWCTKYVGELSRGGVLMSCMAVVDAGTEHVGF